MSLNIVTAPTTEPITLAQAKEHLNYNSTAQDDRITSLILAARQACESETNRGFYTQTWKLTIDRFPGQCGIIPLFNCPVQSVTSIQYYDDNGDLQTLDSGQYQLDVAAEPARLAPARLCNWPTTDTETLGAVMITYVVGWSDVDNIPYEIKQAIKLLVGHYFENTEAVVVDEMPRMLPFAVTMLLNHWSLPIAI